VARLCFKYAKIEAKYSEVFIKQLSVLLVLLTGFHGRAYAQGPSENNPQANPFAAPVSGSNTPEYPFEWTAEKYLEAVQVIDQDMPDEKENEFAADGAGLDQSQMPDRVKSLHVLLKRLRSTNSLPKLSHPAIHSVVLGIPPALLNKMHDQYTDVDWKKIINKTAIVISSAAAVALKNKKSNIPEPINVGATSVAFGWIAGLIVLAIPDIPASAPLFTNMVISFGSYVALKMSNIKKRRKNNELQDQVDEFTLAYEKAIEIAEKESYGWKVESLNLALCKDG